MKKKCAFLVSILLCISMVMTNFAGLGNSIIEAKADGTPIKITISVNIEGAWAGGHIGDADYSEIVYGNTDDEIILAGEYNSDYYLKEWIIVSGNGSFIKTPDITSFTIGTENTEIRAIFEEKKSHNYSVKIDDWTEGEEAKEPVVKNAKGTIVTENIEWKYFVNQPDSFDDMTNMTTPEDGAVETGDAPSKTGSYYVMVVIYGNDEYKYEEKVLEFKIRKKIEITAQNKEETYKPGLTYNLAQLFSIPDGAGTPSYEIVANKDNTVAAGAGTIDGGTLTIEKAGIITIKVTTAQTDTVASASAEAILTVKPATLTNDMLKLVPTSYIFVPGTTYEPVLSVYDGQTELIINKDYEIVTTKSDTSASNKGDYKITVKGIGNYTDEEASISWKVYEIPVDGVANNDVYTNPVSIKVSYANLSKVTLKKDSGEPENINIENGKAEATVTAVGKYILTITDKNGNSIEYNFTIAKKTITIDANDNNEVTYAPNLTYTLSDLFIIPDGAGTATYNIEEDPAVTPAGVGTISNGTLSIEKAGKFKIKITTQESDYVAPGIAYAILTVNKANGSATITVNDIVYGSEPSPTVSSNTNTNYSIKYKGDGETVYGESTNAPTKVGSYIATVTYEATDNYEACSDSASFNITAKDITNSSTINVSENKTVFEYDKQEHTLSFTVSDGTITLGSTDYEIDQKSKASATDIGEYTVTINGIGNYKGTNSIKWKISDTTKPIISGDTTGNTYLNKAEITVTDDYLDSVTLKNNDNNSIKNDYVKNNGSATITVVTPGSYTITATDTSNNQSTYDFVVLSVPNIELVNNIVIKSTEKYNVSGLFKFPEGIGSATYNIVTGNDAGTGEGTLDGQILSITKAGTIKIGVITNREGYVATGSAIGLITGKAITEDQNNQSVQYYLISISYDNIAGSVNNASITYANGSNAYFKATPNEGYVFVNWTENGNVIGTSTELSFTVNGARSLSANFAKIINYNPKVEWTVKFPSSFTKGTAAPVLKYKITYTSTNTSKTTTTEEISVTATSTNNYSAGSADKEVTFVATADLSGYFEDKEGTKPAVNVALSKTYKFKEDSDVSGSGSESGKSESEPEGSVAYNLFYNDEDINIELPDGVDTSVKNGKWASYYSVDESGKVTVTGDRKKAAGAANSLIILPIMGSDDGGNAVQIGEFQYQLPVFYQKPSLKLSSKSGSVNAKLNEDQELYTTVLEKKSTGIYEPLDLSEQDETTLWVGKSGTVTAELGENAGEVKLITKAKASGSIVVKLDNWSETVELKYSVKASNKNVLTASAKKVFMNTAATAGEAQTVTIKINGRDITAEDGVKADLSKLTGKNITVEGVAEDGTLEGSEVSFAYQETAPVKGNYTVTFKTSDGTKVKVTVSVSNAALDSKAVSIKLQTKMDLVSGQKMVLVPTLKGIGGEISEVKLDEAGAALFDCEYNEELNQIYLTAVDASKLNAKEKYNFNVILTVGGVECKVLMKNVKLTAKRPAVKISKVVVSKSKVVAGTAEAEANVLSTVKQGGKTFTVAPTSVEFNGTKNDDGTWTISDKKGTATVSYDAETGKIKVVSAANAAGKMPAIKAVIKYNAGVEVKKTISVKVESKK